MTVTVTKPNHYRYTGSVYIPEAGSMTAYGNGLAGSGGFVPDLSGTGEAIYGGEITVELTQGLGATNGFLYIGPGSASYPLFGGELLVFPITISIPITLSGSSGVPGAGSFSLSSTVFAGDLTLYLQVFLNDPGAPHDVSMSNGLEIDLP
jgi:hypothetical protein